MKKKAFTLIEIFFTIAIVGIILVFVVPSIVGVINQNKAASDVATAKTLNQAANIARFQEKVGPGTYGSDKDAALAWYLSENYIRNTRPADISRLQYLYGYWFPYPFENSAEAVQSFYIQDPTDEDLWNYLAYLEGYGNAQSLLNNEGYADIEEMEYAFGGSIEELLLNWYGITDFSTILDMEKLKNDPQIYFQLLASLDALPQTNLDELFTSKRYTDENRIRTQVTPFTGEQVSLAVSSLKTIGNDPESTTDVSWALRRISTQLLNPNSPDYNPKAFDFTDYPPPGPNGALSSVSLVGTNITPNQLNQFPTLNSVDLGTMDVSGLSFAGKQFNTLDFSKTTGLNGNQLNGTILLDHNFSGLNLAGFDPTGKSLTRANFSNVTGVNPNSFLNASQLYGANLSGMDFRGSTVTQSQINKLNRVNLNNTQGISSAMLNAKSGGATSISGMGLRGINLAALNTNGKRLDDTDLRDTNITASQLQQANSYMPNIKVSPSSIVGFNATGKTLVGADFGPTITTPAQFVATTGITPGAGTVWIDGTRPWG